MAMGWSSLQAWTLGSVLVMALLWTGGNRSLAQEQDVIDAGKREFQRSCATCHGVEAKGNGPSASALNVKPADLTQLSNNHGGVFLFWRTYEKISGADEAPIRGHGTREMPIWGERFRLEKGASETYQMGVRGRILSLVYYLESIQEK
ncbi:MAG: c-type cytochrome [Deltaproteobacteria bacterium]|nr:c-type cytochrome [Deltaproteobacteria bacterium]